MYLKYIQQNKIKLNNTICLLNKRLNNSTSNQLTNNKKINDALEKSKVKLFEFMSIYEEAIGLKEIKEAQNMVLEVILFCFFFCEKF